MQHAAPHCLHESRTRRRQACILCFYSPCTCTPSIAGVSDHASSGSPADICHFERIGSGVSCRARSIRIVPADQCVCINDNEAVVHRHVAYEDKSVWPARVAQGHRAPDDPWKLLQVARLHVPIQHGDCFAPKPSWAHPPISPGSPWMRVCAGQQPLVWRCGLLPRW